MQMCVETESNLLAVVLVKDAKGHARDGLKRHPVIHVLDLSTGNELWKHEIDSDVEMMPTRWNENDEVEYSLDNYHPPNFLNGRLYLFYEGVTSFDARTGKERTREKFRVNEEGLALTEADPVADERNVYTSGRGKVRAISRLSGEEVWEAKDLGSVPEMILTRDVLYARTGGQFTRLEDGETVERGPYGVSAIDLEKGKVLWRYKGADRGITNLVLPDQSTIMIADRDELIVRIAEREEIEALLPWHAAGTLSRREAEMVERALATDAGLAAQYETVREDLAETIVANESLGAPSARAMQKLMADIEADVATSRRARSSFNLGEWLSERLSSFSPRTLAWSATAAALAVVLQAGLLAGMFVNERQGTSFQTASVQTDETFKAGTYALIRFAPEATTGDVNKLLESYKIAIVDGPSGGGVYTVRLAMTGMPKEELAQVVKKLQDEKVVRFIGPKPTE